MTTECPGCAAMRTANELFDMVEAYADEHDISPDAMQAALIETAVQWIVVNTGFKYEQRNIRAPVDGVLIASINEFASAVRYRGKSLPVSPEFKAASDHQARHDH